VVVLLRWLSQKYWILFLILCYNNSNLNNCDNVLILSTNSNLLLNSIQIHSSHFTYNYIWSWLCPYL
jgi:hypothetical protein